MKRKFTVAAGLCMLVTASAIGRSEMTDVAVDLVDPQAVAYGQLVLESLTAEQRQALQTKYKYWSSAGYSVLKAPI